MKQTPCLTDMTLSLYCTDDLDREQKREALSHLERCADCRGKLAGLQTVLDALPRHRLELSEPETLRFAERVVASSRRQGRSNRLQAWGAAATALAAGVLAFAIFNPANVPVNRTQDPVGMADFDVVDNLDLLEEMELLQVMDLLEQLEDRG